MLPLALLLLATHNPLSAEALGRSHDLCRFQSDCEHNLVCYRYHYSDNSVAGLCSFHNFQWMRYCLCFPIGGPKSCSHSRDCDSTPRDICARYQSTSQPLCYSCDHIDNLQLLPGAKEKCDATLSDSPMESPSSTSLPNGDLCTAQLCKNDCVNTNTVTNSRCMPYDLSCQCSINFDIEGCTSSLSHCALDEVCAIDSYTKMKNCLSCRLVSQNIRYLPLDTGNPTSTNSACVLPPPNAPSPLPKPPQKFPLYGVNGYTLDPCTIDAQCISPRRCVSFDIINDMYVPSNSTGDISHCRAVSENILTTHDIPCTRENDCPAGEACFIAPRNYGPAPFSPICLSVFWRGFQSDATEVGTSRVGVNPIERPKTGGRTGDTCRFDTECLPPRRCQQIYEHSYGGCAGRRACMCRQIFLTPCEYSDHCDDHEEVCANYVDAVSRAFCRSRADVGRDPLLYIVDDRFRAANSSDEIVVNPWVNGEARASVTPQPRGKRLIGEPCLMVSDCVSAYCAHITEYFNDCNQRRGCFCVNEWVQCTIEKNGSSLSTGGEVGCREAELCVRLSDNASRWALHACRSRWAVEVADVRGIYQYERKPVVGNVSLEEHNEEPSVSDGPSDQDEAQPSMEDATLENNDGLPASDSTPLQTFDVGTSPLAEEKHSDPPLCVDAALLRRHQHTRIFAFDRRATVLCDGQGSCATAGHMVVWHGRAMMMSTYCAVVGECTRSIREVNSPRMRRAVRVQTYTHGLEFTAFAASYATRVEEMVLAVLLQYVG